MRNAAQALARIGITKDPAIAFPGQRSTDVIRPICHLLNTEYTGIDIAPSLIDAARKASPKRRFLVGNVSACLPQCLGKTFQY